jgi:hypothetical protein
MTADMTAIAIFRLMRLALYIFSPSARPFVQPAFVVTLFPK